MEQLQNLANQKMEELNKLRQSNDALDVLAATMASAAQGGFIGYLLGSFSLDQAGAQVILRVRCLHAVMARRPPLRAATMQAWLCRGSLRGTALMHAHPVAPQLARNHQGQSPQVSAQLAALQKGGPWGQARNLAVFTGVNAGLSLAIKKARGGKEDVWGS